MSALTPARAAEGLALLLAVAAVAWLISGRFRIRATTAASSLVARLDGAAAAEAAELARSGHAMEPWRTSPAFGGLASCCTRCGGVDVITRLEIMRNPPLARNGEVLTCAGGGVPR